MALNGQAPFVFKYTTKRGVPWAAVLFTWAFGLLAFLNVSNSGEQVFQWFSSKQRLSVLSSKLVLILRRSFDYFWIHSLDHHFHHLPTLPQGDDLPRHAGCAAI